MDSYFAMQSVRLVAVILLLLMGGSAYSRAWQGTHHRPYEKWEFFCYAVGFAFAALMNWLMFLVALYTGSYQRGPFHVGLFSVIVTAVYLLSSQYNSARSKY